MPPSDEIQLDRHIREEARWLILRTLYMARPVGAPESIILRGLTGADLPVTTTNVRNELQYLADKSLIVLDIKRRSGWLAKLSAYGVDVCEYAKDAPVGILRPDEA